MRFTLVLTMSLALIPAAHAGPTLCARADAPTYWPRVEHVTGVTWADWLVWRPMVCAPIRPSITGTDDLGVTTGTDDLGVVVDSATVGAP